MKTRKFYFRWQVVAVLWLMMAFPVCLVHGQEQGSAQQGGSPKKGVQVVTGHVCDKQGVPIIGASVTCLGGGELLPT